MIFISDQDYEIGLKNGISKQYVYNRVINCGWDIETAITKPVKKRPYLTSPAWMEYGEQAIKTGITRQCFHQRIARGMTPKEAAITPKAIGNPKGGRNRGKNAKIQPGMIETAAENGISEKLLRQRVYRGRWDIERAMTEPVNRGRKGNFIANSW